MSFLDIIDSTRRTKPNCTACGMSRTCETPFMPVVGEGRRGILIVGEAPSQTEDQQGQQLIGEATSLLRRALRECGVNLERDCWKTNAVVCRPPGSREPTHKEIEYCRPNLIREIEALRPHVIITLGLPAVWSVCHPSHADIGQELRWVGHTIPEQRLNAWVCPTWHPVHILKRSNKDAVTPLWFGRHLKAAVALADRGCPWPEGPPDYLGEVQCHVDAEAAALALDAIPRDRGLMVFDYETDRLKPDRSDSQIACASVAWGMGYDPEIVFSFVWHGEAIEAFKRLMRAPLGKCAHNYQMEDRWTRKAFGAVPRNWRWCTQQVAHAMDNREGITSLDFQGYIHFGQADYDANVSPYLAAKGSAIISHSNDRNNIRDVPMMRLLRYCGVDSSLSYRLAWRQAEYFGMLHRLQGG